MNKIVTATEARKNFFQLVRFAATPGASVTVALEGSPPVIMMSQGEFEGWMETLEILSDPELVKDIEEGIQDMKKGRTITFEALKKKLKL